jgi:glycosyltransferase involved in cell wall biosynthesis
MMANRGTLVFISRHLRSGGGLEIQTLVIAEQLAEAGWQIRMIYEHAGDLLERWKRIAHCTCAPIRLDTVSPLVTAHEILYLHEPDLPEILLPICGRVCAVVHLHLPPEHLRTGLRRLKGTFRSPAAAEVFGRRSPVARFIAVSEFSKRQWCRGGIPSNRVDVVWNGIDPVRYSHPISRNESRNDIGLAQTELVLGFLGRIDSSKGIETALSVHRRLRTELPVKLLVIGGPTIDSGNLGVRYEERLRHEFSESVVWFGKRRDPERILPAVDLLLVPSRWGEPFGLVAAEAMRCGAVPVVFQDGGLPEVLGPELIGNVVRNEAAMLQQASHLLTNPGELARQRTIAVDRAKTVLSATEMGKRIDGVLQQTQFSG